MMQRERPLRHRPVRAMALKRRERWWPRPPQAVVALNRRDVAMAEGLAHATWTVRQFFGALTNP